MTKPEPRGKSACIIGTGSYLPERVMTNADIAKMVDTTDEWIRTRTGICERHIAAPEETTSDMGAEASRRALADAGVAVEEVDLIIVATFTPDTQLPSAACIVQDKIGATKAFCFDVSAACSGFLYALKVAKQFLENDVLDTILVIGAEKLSCVVDWTDRGTCILFGDGAGAAVLSVREDRPGLMASFMGSDGSLRKLLHIPAGGSDLPASSDTVDEKLHYMKMGGNEVFKHAVRCMCDAGQRVLVKCGLTMEDVDWVIPHQANMRIIQAVAGRMGNCIDKFVVNLDRVGNTSAASVAIALDEAVKDGRVKKGDIVLFIVFGGGFTWGATVMEW